MLMRVFATRMPRIPAVGARAVQQWSNCNPSQKDQSMSANERKQQSFNPPGSEASANKYRLSQAMRVGDMVWVSGQVGVTPERTVPEGIEAQTRLTFENLKAVLESAGATLDDIVELTLLLTDTSIDLEPFYRVKDEYIRPPYPAITGFGVSSLALPGLLIEVRAVAVAGSGANK